MQLHAPTGGTYYTISKQMSRKKNVKNATHADINKLSTIVEITNNEESILLTSDAVKKEFKKLAEHLLLRKFKLVQVPHHGSKYNNYEKFWESLNRVDFCPAIFSVGDEPKDKLPDKETVNFFNKNNYNIYSTNCIYGINDVFSCASIKNVSSTALGAFSRLKSKPNSLNSSNYQGDQTFQIWN